MHLGIVSLDWLAEVRTQLIMGEPPRSRASSMSECTKNSNGAPTTVVNDLLCYVFSAMKRISMQAISDNILMFYPNVAINDAKHVLWDAYQESLGPMETRRNSVKRTAATADLDDILSAAKDIDSTCCGDDGMPVIFVSKDAFSMPCNQIPTSGSRNRLEILEYEMKELKSLIKQAFDRDHYPFGPSNVQNPNSIWDMPNSYANHDIHSSRSMENETDTTTAKQLSPEIQVHSTDESVTNARPPCPPPPIPAQQPSYAAVAEQLPFKVVESRRKPPKKTVDDAGDVGGPSRIKQPGGVKGRARPKVCTGSRTGTSFGAGPQRADLFVFRVKNEFCEDDVVKYLSDQKVNAVTIERVSRDDAVTKSFHVVVECFDIKSVFNPEFWPLGVGCKRFYKIKKNGSANRN